VNPRLIGVAVVALAAVGGSGRLVYNEVRLASVSSVSSAQAHYRQADATRASRLTLELAAAEGSISALRSDVATATSAADTAQARVEQLQGELGAARADFEATVGERNQRIEALSASLDDATRERDATASALKQRVSELERAEASLATLERERAALAQQNTELDRQAKYLAQELSRREEALQRVSAEREQVQARLKAAHQNLDATQTELAEALKRAGETEAVLKAVQDAGVDVDRLSGADPMPLVRGFVVKVDTAAVPPVVLVHVGARAGLRAGDQLYVVRKGRRVATLEVDAQQEDICTTRVVAGERGLTLAPRDEVFSWEPER